YHAACLEGRGAIHVPRVDNRLRVEAVFFQASTEQQRYFKLPIGCQFQSQPDEKRAGCSLQPTRHSQASFESLRQGRGKQNKKDAIKGPIHDENQAKKQEGKERVIRRV